MFEEFPKIARLSRECVITEKIDGTNAQVLIVKGTDAPDVVALSSAMAPLVIAADAALGLLMFAGSRTRFIRPEEDNHGFATWVKTHAAELWQLGEGRHFGEWWGSGIQRGYGLTKGEKRFSLFNVARWHEDRDREKYPQDRPACCHVVPKLHEGACDFNTTTIDTLLGFLRDSGSFAAPGFMKPEGIVIWHEAARTLFKKTLEKDEEGKEQKARRLAHAGSNL